MHSANRAQSRFIAFCIEPFEGRILFSFGVTATTGGAASYVVDNGSDLQFSVLRNGATTTNQIHLGDITSIKYKGQEMLTGYSHYEQGLTSASTISYTVDNTNGWILITGDASADTNGGAVIQYYAVRRNDNNIYMASLPLDAGNGEGRFIAYLDKSIFTNREASSDNNGQNGTIEGGDVYGHPDGTTTSKFYNTREMIDNQVHGVTGVAGTTAVGAWMYMGNREHSSGGPFFKDIDFQTGSSVEMYNYLFSGHTQTEAYRTGMLGPYALQFNDGSVPVAPDYSWMETMKNPTTGQLLISGLVPAEQRGMISGIATGNPVGHQTVVALSNTAAQYWDRADASGNYAITGVLPGTYTETIYDNELAVGTKTVTVAAGAITNANIINTVYVPPNPIFRIGAWDGTPVGFLNADKIQTMHPSDVRMSSWTSTPNFVVGTNTDAQWAMAQFKDVNNSQRITFNLTAAQVQNLTLRIGLTLTFDGGRNAITVNAGQSYAWSSVAPTASSSPDSRGVTRGTWRGRNQMYTYRIPSTALRAGTNTINLPVVSGTNGVGFLSSNVVYDALDLIPTSTDLAPAIASVTVTPASSMIATNGIQAYTAVAKDAAGNIVPANFDWSAVNGSIDANGNYVAAAIAGIDTITVVATRTGEAGYLSSATSTQTATRTITGAGSATVNVIVNQPPTISVAATASLNPAGTTTALNVLGADDFGESNLIYTWATLGTLPTAVTFATNGTNAAKTTTATFTKAGTYNFAVTVTDSYGLTTTSNVSVNVSFGAFTDSVDIGSPPLPGSLNYNSSTGAYTIQGNGADIGNTADQFRFSYANITGDGSAIARLAVLGNTNVSAKAGVMFRDSTASDAAYALVRASPANTVKFETRGLNGSVSSTILSLKSGVPIYVKLVRVGNIFTGYYSTNGTAYTKMASKTVAMRSNALVGLALTSHDSTLLNTNVFDHVSIDEAPVLVTAKSNKLQGGSTYGLNLSLNSASTTVEPRSGGANQISFTFSKPVVAADGVLSANEFGLTGGTFSSATLSGLTLLLSLASVTNASRLVVNLIGLTDAAGNAITGTTSVTVRNLVGDVDVSGVVNTADSTRISAASGQALSQNNYLLDLNETGRIDAVDIVLAKTRLGNTVK